MKKICCYIRQNRSLDKFYWKIFPWVVETYQSDKFLYRRDFTCKNIGECWRIVQAAYGDRIIMTYSKAARRAYNRRWKGIF